MMDKVVTRYEITDHGIEASDYFQGFSCPREYDQCATGIGDNPHEALEDALEMLAQGGWETETVVNDLPDTPSVQDEQEANADAGYPPCRNCDGEGTIIENEGTEEEEGVECPDCDGTGNAEQDEDMGENNLYYHISIAVKGIDPTLDGVWLTPQVKQMAGIASDEKDPDTVLVLTDMMEEAGCTNQELLETLRDESYDMDEVRRILNWMLGADANSVKANGQNLKEFVTEAQAIVNVEWPEIAWPGMNNVRPGLYDFIKKQWPYWRTPEDAASDYMAAVESGEEYGGLGPTVQPS